MSRFTVPLSKITTALAATCTALAAGCSGSVTDPDPFPPGLLAIQLQPGDAVQLDSVSYVVSGPGGFMRSGPVAVALDSHASFSFKVEDLPPGTGYALSVDADATLLQAGDGTHCRGSTAFAIETDKSTAVSIGLQCDGVASTGSTNDDRSGNQCPVVKGLRAVPAGGPVGTDVELYADIDDAADGPSPTTYMWTSAGGMLAGSNIEATFHCTRAGVSTVNLACSDGDAACSAAHAFVYVVCTDAKCLAAHNCDALPDPVAGSGGGAGHGHSVPVAGVGGSSVMAGAGGHAGAGAGGGSAVIGSTAGSHASPTTTVTTTTTMTTTGTTQTNANPPQTQTQTPARAGAGGVGGAGSGGAGAPAANGGSGSAPMRTWPTAGTNGSDTHQSDDERRRRHRPAEGGAGASTEAGSGATTTNIAGSTGSISVTTDVGGAGGGESPANTAGESGQASTNASGAGGAGL